MKSTIQKLGKKLIKTEIGASLVEELVTIAVIGLGIVVLVAMITTGALGVKGTNDSVRADILAKSQLELIKDAPYRADPTSAPYPTVSSLPGYSVAVGIEYWNISSSSFQAGVRNDGLQKITITVTSGATQITQLVDYKVER